jgi:DNA-binding transcriptional LysR family regulator
MADVSSRLLRYFVTVAEELHFTQAAQRLYVAQPALSKAIRRLEEELGFALFVRNRHSVALTAAGQALLPAARRTLDELDNGIGAAQAAHRAATRLVRVGYHASIGSPLLQAIIEGFRRRRPDWQVELRLGDWANPAGAVLNLKVDAALLHVPVLGQDGLHTRVIRRDPRWVALPAGHRLASRETVRLRDLADEPFIALPSQAGPLRDAWLAVDRFDRPPTIGAEVSNAEDWFEAIAAGRGIAMLSQTTSRVHQRPGILYRLVEDAPSSDLVLAWRKDNTDPVLRDFVGATLDAAGTVDIDECHQ